MCKGGSCAKGWHGPEAVATGDGGMADGFEAMVDDARSFFAGLEKNNSKDWFNPRKAQYEAEIARPAKLFADLIAEDLSRTTGRTHAAKIFRIYRDVRFSKDKTPLNAHLHILWSDPAGDALTPAWFFGLAPGYFMLGAGIMELQGAELARFRAHVDANGDELQAALDRAEARGVTISDWGPEPLKRVPKPYDADHPHGDLLRRRALAVNVEMAQNWRYIGLVAAVNRRIDDLRPVVEAMSP